MRIHVIRARTLPAALQQVRETYGENAIVLDTATAPEGVAVRVGVELDGQSAEMAQPAQKKTEAAETVDSVSEALAWHGVPALITRSLLLGVEAHAELKPEEALARALDRTFRFERPENLATPLAIVGPPGSGKTSVMAKLAVAARKRGDAHIAIVNADLETAGARSRIGAFAQALGVKPFAADSPAAIASAVGAAGKGAYTLIDTSARAPGDLDDIEDAAREIESAAAGLLVLSAAIAPVEAAELAECFASAGATALVVSQLDIARRIGALLAAADAGDLAIAGVSLGRKVGAGLVPLTPEALAKLILAPPQPIAKPRPRRRAAPPATSNSSPANNSPAEQAPAAEGAAA